LLKNTTPDAALPSDGLHAMANVGILINLMLMALNLLPILPLDGGRIAVSLLPHSMAMTYARMEPYGFMIVIALLVTGVLGWLVQPLIGIGELVLSAILGL